MKNGDVQKRTGTISIVPQANTVKGEAFEQVFPLNVDADSNLSGFSGGPVVVKMRDRYHVIGLLSHLESVLKKHDTLWAVPVSVITRTDAKIEEPNVINRYLR